MRFDETTVWRQRLAVGSLLLMGSLCILLAGVAYYFLQHRPVMPPDEVLVQDPERLLAEVDGRLSLAGASLLSFALGIFLCFTAVVMDIQLRQKAIILVLARMRRERPAAPPG